MRPVSETQRRLLQQAVHGFLQRHPEATITTAELDIAGTLHVSQASVQKWRAGHSIAAAHIPRLAEWAVRRAGMDREWLRAFLRACDLVDPALEATLFGPTGPPDLAGRCQDLHRRFWGTDRLNADPSFFLRPALTALLDAFLRSDRPGLILVAPSGLGKTAFVLHLARSGSIGGYTVLALPAADLDGERPLPALLASLLSPSFPDTCALSWPLLLVLDGVNESPDMVRLTWQADRALPQATGLKLILTFRPESFQVVRHNLSLNEHCYFTDLPPGAGTLTADPPAIRLLPFSAAELPLVYEQYRHAYRLQTPFSALPADLQKTIRHPLLLRLTAEAYAGTALPETLPAGQVLQDFLDHLYRHGRVGRSDLLFLEERIVPRMLTPGRLRNAIQVGEVLTPQETSEISSPLVRLADAGLLASTNGRLDEPLRFAHERFYEHFAERHLVRERELAADPAAFYAGLRDAPWYLQDPLCRLVAAEIARKPDRRLWTALAALPGPVLAGALEDTTRRHPEEGTRLLRALWRMARPSPLGRPAPWQENLGRAVLQAAGALGDADLLEYILWTASPSLRNAAILQAKDLWADHPEAARDVLERLAGRLTGPFGLPHHPAVGLFGPLFLLSLFDYGDRPEVLGFLRDLVAGLAGEMFGGVRGRLLLRLAAHWFAGWLKQAAVAANLTGDLDRDFQLSPPGRASLRALAPYVDWETPGFGTEAVYQNIRVALETGSLLAGWIIVLAIVQQGLGNSEEGWPVLRRLVGEAATPPVPPWADAAFHSAYELLRVAPSRDPILWDALQRGMAYILEHPEWHRVVQAHRLGRPRHPPGLAQGVAPYALARSAARLPVTAGPFWDAVRRRLESGDPSFALDYLRELRFVALDGRRPALALRMLETRRDHSPLVAHPDPAVRERLVDLLASVRAIASEDVRDFLERCAPPELAAQVARHPVEPPAYSWLYFRLEEWVYRFLARSRSSRRLVAELFALATETESVREWVERGIGCILNALRPADASG